MLHSFEQIAGWTLIVVVLTLVSINAAYMLASPRAWIEVPDWFTQRSPRFSMEKFGSGFGALQLRICGAGLLGLISLILFESLFRR
jgi:hypothetical protein